jgi:hypothetical protein
MEKSSFIAIVEQIVAGFEEPSFAQQWSAAQASGDVPAMMALPAAIQNAAFAAHGCPDSAAFKAAGKSYALDPAVGPLLVRMKAALK